jgi:hypothetical protein
VNEPDPPMANEKLSKTPRPTEQFRYRDRVIHSGQLVKTSGAAWGFFRVRRVWGHHVVLESLSITEVLEPSRAIALTVQHESKKSKKRF